MSIFHFFFKRSRLFPLHHRHCHSFPSSSSAAAALPDAAAATTCSSSFPSSTVQFLISQCQFPPPDAALAARSLPIPLADSPARSASALSVVSLLRSHGLSPSVVAHVLSRRPLLLLSRPEATLAPKLSFLASLLPRHLPQLLYLNPALLPRSLTNHIKPLFSLLRSFLGSEDDFGEALLRTVRRHRQFLSCNVATTTAPNVALLVDRGVPADHITTLLTTHPRSFTLPTDRFARAVDAVAAFGLHPSAALFVHALRAVNGLSDDTWERRREFFKTQLGWSDEDFRLAFCRAPLYLLVSDEKMKRMVEFFLEVAGLEPSDLSRQPKLLMYGLEKRILPRYRVFQVLESKGMFDEERTKSKSRSLKRIQSLKRNRLLILIFTCSEEKFMDKYVVGFSEFVPDLINLYRGKIELEEILSCKDKHEEIIAPA